MKYWRKILSFLMVVSVLCCLPLSAGAVDARASDYFVATRTYLYQMDTAKFAISFEVTAKSRMEELGVTSIVVKRSADGSTWQTMRTCVPSVYPQMMGADTIFHSDYVLYNATAGYYYKAYVTYYAKNSTGSSEYSTWTEILYLPSS